MRSRRSDVPWTLRWSLPRGSTRTIRTCAGSIPKSSRCRFCWLRTNKPRRDEQQQRERHLRRRRATVPGCRPPTACRVPPRSRPPVAAMSRRDARKAGTVANSSPVEQRDRGRERQHAQVGRQIEHDGSAAGRHISDERPRRQVGEPDAARRRPALASTSPSTSTCRISRDGRRRAPAAGRIPPAARPTARAPGSPCSRMRSAARCRRHPSGCERWRELPSADRRARWPPASAPSVTSVDRCRVNLLRGRHSAPAPARERGPRLRHRHTRPRAPDDRSQVETDVRIVEQVLRDGHHDRLHHDRHEEIWATCRLRRRRTPAGVTPTIVKGTPRNRDRTADDRGIEGEAALPVAVADHRHWMARRHAVVVRAERRPAAARTPSSEK